METLQWNKSNLIILLPPPTTRDSPVASTGSVVIDSSVQWNGGDERQSNHVPVQSGRYLHPRTETVPELLGGVCDLQLGLRIEGVSGDRHG